MIIRFKGASFNLCEREAAPIIKNDGSQAFSKRKNKLVKKVNDESYRIAKLAVIVKIKFL